MDPLDKSKSIHKSMLRSALSVKMDLELAGSETTATNGFRYNCTAANSGYTDQVTNNSDSYANVTAYMVNKSIQEDNKDAWVTLAAPSLGSTINLDQVSVGVFITTLKSVFLRALPNGEGGVELLLTRIWPSKKPICEPHLGGWSMWISLMKVRN